MANRITAHAQAAIDQLAGCPRRSHGRGEVTRINGAARAAVDDMLMNGIWGTRESGS